MRFSKVCTADYCLVANDLACVLIDYALYSTPTRQYITPLSVSSCYIHTFAVFSGDLLLLISTNSHGELRMF